MELDIIKEKIKKAEKAVENVTDPALKSKAFEVVLNNMLKQQESENIIRSGIPEDATVTPPIESFNGFEKICQVTNLRKEQLEHIFEFEGNNFTIISDIPGKSEAQKQQNASVIILTTRNYLCNNKEIKTSELKKYLDDMGIGSLVNLSTNLKGFENYIIKKGKSGGQNIVYRITTPGIQKGVELIKDMAGEQNG